MNRATSEQWNGTSNPSGDHAELGQSIGDQMFDRSILVRSFGDSFGWDFTGPMTRQQANAIRQIEARAKRSQIEVLGGDETIEIRATPKAPEPSDKGKLQRTIDRANEILDNRDMPREPSEGRQEYFRSKLGEHSARLDELETRLARAKDIETKPPGDAHYWHRIYNVKAIRDRYDDFVDLLASGFARDRSDDGEEAVVTEEIREVARETADRIIGDGGFEESEYGLGNLVTAMKQRRVPLSNTELTEFIVNDATSVMQIYARRMGPAIEMYRAFGSRNLEKEITFLRGHAAKMGYDKETADQLVWQLEMARDRVLNSLHAKDPLSWDNRVARFIKNMGNTQLLGQSIFAQMAEVGRTIAAEGHEPFFKAINHLLNRAFKGVSLGPDSRIAGEAWDYASARTMAKTMEDDSAVLATGTTWAERKMASAQNVFFKLNLMTPFNTIMKDFSSFMSGHRLLRDSKMLAEAFRSGKTKATLSKAEYKVMENLASWGIDSQTALLIADMPIEKAEGGLLLSNVEAWSGAAGEKARNAYLAALQGNLRSNVITQGPLQRAAIMDGIFRWNGERVEWPLLSPIFQLMSFPVTAGYKISHSLLSGRERSRFATTTALLIAGYISARLVAGDNWEFMDWKEQTFMVIDRSGLLGPTLDPVKRLEELTGYGPRAAMGLKQFGGEGELSPAIGAVAGPAIGIQAGMIEALVSDGMDDDRRTSLVRRWVPMAGMLWWNDTLKQWSKAWQEIEGFDLDMDEDDGSEAVEQ